MAMGLCIRIWGWGVGFRVSVGAWLSAWLRDYIGFRV